MRTIGLVLLAGGVLGFLYCSSQLSGLQPVPAGVELGDYMNYEAGKLELARYAAALFGFIGLLLAFFPQGR
ncbi:MAG TPA: hypothetical protein VIG50_08995 [Vicinamibacteria bacterium]|jgi:hypothetical protein